MIFDSLGHATVDGHWLKTELRSDFKKYSEELKKNKYLGGMVVGLEGINGYDHESFINSANKFKNLYPVAGFNPKIAGRTELKKIKKLGFVGIKIHTRFSKINLKHDKKKIVSCLNYCAEFGLVVFFCTYFATSLESYPDYDPFLELVKILKKSQSTKIVLVHGGVQDLIKYSELCRFNSNLILDLSLVLMKYPLSSIESDIFFLFNYFDRKICIGSDYPEYSLKNVKTKFTYFSKGLSRIKKNNIAYLNIMNFLNIKSK